MRVLRRPVPLLTAAIGVIGANSLVLPPIAPAIASDLTAEIATILKAAAAYGAGTAISALILAPRADVIGADRALRSACFVLILALLLSALAPSVSFLVIGQGLAGIGAGIALPSIYSLAAQVAPPGREKQTISTVLTGWTLSLIGGVTLSAMIADHMGWRGVYGLMCCLTAGVWVLLGRCDLRAVHLAQGATSPFTALKVKGVLRGLLANGMLMLAFNGAYIFLGAHVVEHLNLSTSATGAITMLYGLGFAGAVLFTRFVDALSRRLTGLLSFGGLSAIYAAMHWSSMHFVGLLSIALVWGVFQHFALNMVVDRLTGLDITQRGAIMGLNSAITYLTVTFGAVFYHCPYEYGGLSACLAFSALFAAVAAIESIWPTRARTYSVAE